MKNYASRPLKWWLSTPLYASRLIRYHTRLKFARFHGINDLVRKVWPHLPVKRNGFFVEAGANDGVTGSNTLFLERFMGWRGLCVEPLPDQVALCRSNRKKRTHVANFALVEDKYEHTNILIYPASLMSVVEGAMSEQQRQRWIEKGEKAQGLEKLEPFQVPTITLSQLLDEIDAPPIDFLSLDVEGYELQVLRGIDFTRHAPRAILVEVLFNRAEIFELLQEHYDVAPKVGRSDALFTLKS